MVFLERPKGERVSAGTRPKNVRSKKKGEEMKVAMQKGRTKKTEQKIAQHTENARVFRGRDGKAMGIMFEHQEGPGRWSLDEWGIPYGYSKHVTMES